MSKSLVIDDALSLNADTPFMRVWRGFLTSRIMVAIALLTLQGLSSVINQTTEPAALALCIAYFVTTAMQRAWAHRAPPAAVAGPQWLPSIGLDIVVVCALQILHVGNMNYTPLLGLPVLMAAVLGTLTMALGTAAGVTLLLLAWAWWLGGTETQRYLQSALTGTGYFIVAFLVHQLASRLVREQAFARQSKMAAEVQTEVNAVVIQNLNDGVMVLDAQYLVRTTNPATLRLLADTPVTPKAWNLTEQPVWAPLVELAQRTYQTEQSQMADIDLLLPDQSPIGLHVRTWLTSDHAEDPNAERLCVMFLHDLREMQARLRTEKLAAMGRMSAAVAHEIRNPLAAIVQANALLEEDLQDPHHQRLAAMVRQNADRLAKIAEEVLDIARVQHQLHHTAATTLALDDTIAHICSDWCAHDTIQRQPLISLKANGHQVEFETDHLRRVLVNLLDNALRYMQPGSPSLIVSTKSHATGQLSVQVWSNGMPLDKSVERHLFEPFFSSESRSTGLGLYICRELCHRHGADISYTRLTLELADGPVSGNAFTVSFRRATPSSMTAPLFDSMVV